jgi:hypothetical protein
MSDSLLGVAVDLDCQAEKETPGIPEAMETQRPAEIPEKFWDPATEQVRTDALVKSYIELERKLGSLSDRNVPETSDDYQVEIGNEFLANDPEVNARLHEAGFSQEQAQLVYDLASERLLPMINEVAAVFEADNEVERLVRQFGGSEKWRVVSRQIDAWGRSRLPEHVYNALSTTSDGVLAMHKMMNSGEPGMLREGANTESGPSEQELKELMRNPSYWRDQDAKVVERVREGFRQLYGD